MRFSTILISIVIAGTLAGCASSGIDSATSRASKSNVNKPMEIRIVGARQIYVGNWQGTIDDLPAMQQQWHLTSVSIENAGGNLKGALAAKAAFESAGVSDVTISGSDHGNPRCLNVVIWIHATMGENQTDAFSVNGWQCELSDIPSAVKEWSIRSAVIGAVAGNGRIDFRFADEIAKALKAAGVQDVSIERGS